MNNLDVTVIIAAYNTSRSIERAIHSALNQRGVEIEVIVVNDGSDDGLKDILNTIDDPRLRLFENQENLGVSHARNQALNNAKGTWIAILDSDDKFSQDRLIRLKQLGEQRNADIVCDNQLVEVEFSDHRETMYDTELLKSIQVMTLEAYIKGNSGRKNQRYAFGYFKPFIKKEFINLHQLRYSTKLELGEDFIFIADALAMGARCIIEPSIGYHYMRSSNSLSQKLTAERMNQIIQESYVFERRHKLDKPISLALSNRLRYLKKIYAQMKLADSVNKMSIFYRVKNAISYLTIFK